VTLVKRRGLLERYWASRVGLVNESVPDDARWSSIEQHLRQTGKVLAERPQGLVLLRGDRAIVIDRARVLDETWLVLRTPVCDEKDLDPRAVHERNGLLAVAALVVESGRYLFRVAVPLKATDPAALDKLIALAFDAAKRLRPFRAVEGDAAAAFGFAYYTE
jgi:hypothetical protein